MSSLSRQQLETWLKGIDVKGSILDIGGGQKSLEGRTKTFEPENYIVMDNTEEFKPDVNWDIPKPGKVKVKLKMDLYP